MNNKKASDPASEVQHKPVSYCIDAEARFNMSVEHKFLVRQGPLWPELHEIIRQGNSDLIVVATHGRHRIRKLFFGSVTEQIFRRADCSVLTFGPHAHERPWIATSCTPPAFLFATDFGQASVRGLHRAVAVANQLGARIVFLTILAAIPPQQRRGCHTGADLSALQEDARVTTLRRLAELADNAGLDVRPECHVEFTSTKLVSEIIVETAERLRADLIVMGRHHSAHIGLISRLGWATADGVIRHASSPVLILNSVPGDFDKRPRPIDAIDGSLSKADLIRIHGFGVTW